MANIEVVEEELFSHRPRAIGEMLSGLQGRQVACQAYPGMFRGGRAFAAHSGGVDPKSHFSQWRFRTVSRDVECQYYELWKSLGQDRLMFLDRAYLHLYRIDRDAKRSAQMLCLHTDPNDNVEDTRLRRYKRGLHLHVNEAADPIPKCHLSVIVSHLGDHLEQILSSVENLTTAMQDAVDMIRYELIERLL